VKVPHDGAVALDASPSATNDSALSDASPSRARRVMADSSARAFASVTKRRLLVRRRARVPARAKAPMNARRATDCDVWMFGAR